MDTTDEAAVQSAIDGFAARCGRLDFAMNSAGVALSETLYQEFADPRVRNEVCRSTIVSR